ncbi:hypothetical protein ACIQFZ_41450 [Streptomyces sp. NPDC093064]|uniref:hypothetical protein n=1 Tax=Streptomyces sp. NPDC093064 TaxID=3366020 RepID=UPI00382C8A48
MSTGTLPPASDWIRGISASQPWAACIVAGAKTIENRPQHWSRRGRLLLHAGLQIDQPALHLPLIARTIRDRDLPTGTVIGVAQLTGCHQRLPALHRVGGARPVAPVSSRTSRSSPCRSPRADSSGPGSPPRIWSLPTTPDIPLHLEDPMSSNRDVDHTLAYLEPPASPLWHRDAPKARPLTPDQQRRNRELLVLAQRTPRPRTPRSTQTLAEASQ